MKVSRLAKVEREESDKIPKKLKDMKMECTCLKIHDRQVQQQGRLLLFILWLLLLNIL